MATNPIHSKHGILAAWLAGAALCHGAVEVAGKLLVDLDAADFSLGAERWPQHSETTGIPGDFMPKGSPTRQKVAGADAVVFDGDGDYFVGPITTPALHAPGAKHSVEIWVYQGNVRDQESVVSWGKRWGRPNMSLAGFRYGSDPEFGAIGRWGSSESAFTVVPEAGKWHLLSYTFNGTQQAVYVDGELDNTKPVGFLDAHDMLPIHLGLEICGDLKPEGQYTHYSGALARVRIHSQALTAAQVKHNFEDERAAFPGLKAKPLRQLPIHRFSFNASAGPAPDGSVVQDPVGGLSAVIRGADAEFTGHAVRLPGGSSATEAYVDFPNGLISSRENLTFEFWETQSETQVWCRILSIGTNKVGEITGPGGDFTGSETLTLFGNVGARQLNRFARSFGNFPNGGPDRDPVEYPDSDYGVEFHQVITYNDRLKEWHWYRNGLLMEVIPDLEGPTTIDDVNVWLGRSEFSADNNFKGLIDEVRVYNRCLDDGEIYGNFLAGPDKLSLGQEAMAMTWMPRQGGSFSFINTVGTNSWNTGDGGPHPDGPGSTATFASVLEGDQDITLSAPVTLGSLNLGSTGPKGSYTLRAEGPGAITMSSGDDGPSSISQLPGSTGNSVLTPLTLATDTEITNPSSKPLVIGGPLKGEGDLIKTGTGPVSLTGDARKFSGGVRIVAGDLLVGGSPGAKMPEATHYSITAPGNLILNGTSNDHLEGSFTGTGGVTQRGAGKLTLDGSAAFSNTGSIIVDDGAGPLTSEGSIDGPVEIRSDGDVILCGKSRTILRKWLSIGSLNGGNLIVKDSAIVEIQGPGHLNIGDLGTGQSTMSMEGGTLACREMFIGKNSGLAGVLIQSGGAISKESLLDTRVGGGLPEAHDAWGAWHMTGGSFTDQWNLQIGAYGTGVMEVDGGEVKVTGFLSIGRYELTSPSHGLLDVKSGSVRSTQTNNYVLVGEEGVGVLNIRNRGAVTCANKLIIGAGSIENPGDGTVNLLCGGTLTTSGISQMNESEAKGRLNLDGGLLVAGASNPAFLEGLDVVEIGKHGACIDTHQSDVTIKQPLLAPVGNGIVRIPVANGGSGYVGAPFVEVSGGGGSGATAMAEVADGSVRSILITNPGSGYTSIPDVRIIGGGAGTGFKMDPPVLAANHSGGLTKTGDGTLTLAADNTYAGITSVEQGGLQVTGSVTGPVRVSNGATLGGNGTVNGTVEIVSGASISPASGDTLCLKGDLEIHGSMTVQTAESGANCGRVDVEGTLNLVGAKLSFKPGSVHASGAARVIASYGTLHGRFTPDESIPAGYVIDYAYKGLKQIALVTADTDAE